MGSITYCPSFPQPSQEVVKEMTQFSKDTLEKIDKARSEGLYHEVRIHFSEWMGKVSKCSPVKEGSRRRKGRPQGRAGCSLGRCL